MTLIEQIINLTELEFEELMEQISDHVYKNKLDHVVRKAFELPDIDDLEEHHADVISEMEREHEVELDIYKDRAENWEQAKDLIEDLYKLFQK